jgi:hypothetical protein
MSGNKRWYAENAVHSDKWSNGPPSNKKRAFSPIRHERSGPDRRRSPRRNSPERRHFDSGGYGKYHVCFIKFLLQHSN